MIKYCRYKVEKSRYTEEHENIGKYSTLDIDFAKQVVEGIFNGNEVIKLADTIEELCDEFVFERRLLGKANMDFEDKSVYRTMGGFIPFKDLEYNIYGAIWTDKGLIYVAKMNEKGELELL